MTLWGGRFAKATDELMFEFNASLSFDRRLGEVDVRGSIAWARGLARAGLLTQEEANQIVAGLEQVKTELSGDTFSFQLTDEDIHTAVERRLTEIVGPAGGKLHTGRSRNDQVATDLRLYLLGVLPALEAMLIELQTAIADKADGHLDLVMPGYTHLQPAQPVLFSHWLMSFFWKLQRDRERLAGLAQRTATLPLGSGALAGNPYGIDRHSLAAELGFHSVTRNSMDAVCDRDFAVEFLSWAALLQVHLSGLAEDLVIWSSPAFGFVELDDAYATGSSLMPQKKNPDALELMRGKSGRVIGQLTGMMTALKGLPSTYNKDLQEDKEALFDVVDTLWQELPIAAGVIRTLSPNGERMASALSEDCGSILATDLADYLVQKGVPFRQSHHLVGRMVQRACELGVTLSQLDLAEFQAIHPAISKDVYQQLDFARSVAAREGVGGTAPAAVRVQIREARMLLARPQFA